MLLILFWVSFLMFYFSYLFSVMFLAFLVMVLMLVYYSGMVYMKYLVILIYVSGVVVFMLYISCMCWLSSDKFMKSLVLLGVIGIFLFDFGSYSKFSDVSEFLWMYLFFGFLFNVLVMSYSLQLFKISGSLRF